MRTEMHSTFRDIYKLQENLNLAPTALQDYLNSDGDTEPMNELNKRKIQKQDSLNMEGLLTTEELTHALFKVMKGGTSPGIDGFTVNYI